MNIGPDYLASTLRRLERGPSTTSTPRPAPIPQRQPRIVGYYGTVSSVVSIDRRRQPNNPDAVESALAGIVKDYTTPKPAIEREDPTFGNEKLLRGIPAVGRVGGAIFGTRPGDPAKNLEH